MKESICREWTINFQCHVIHVKCSDNLIDNFWWNCVSIREHSSSFIGRRVVGSLQRIMLQHCAGNCRILMSLFIPLIAINELRVHVLPVKIRLIVQKCRIAEIKGSGRYIEGVDR